MTGVIEKIDPLKQSFSGAVSFIRVYFKIKDEEKAGEFIWAKTDVVPSFRNYARWEKVLKVGNVLSHLTFKEDKTVDADSRFVLLGNIFDAEVEKENDRI